MITPRTALGTAWDSTKKIPVPTVAPTPVSSLEDADQERLRFSGAVGHRRPDDQAPTQHICSVRVIGTVIGKPLALRLKVIMGGAGNPLANGPTVSPASGRRIADRVRTIREQSEESSSSGWFGGRPDRRAAPQGGCTAGHPGQRRPHLPYDRPLLSNRGGCTTAARTWVTSHSTGGFLRRQRHRTQTRCSAQSLDPAARTQR